MPSSILLLLLLLNATATEGTAVLQCCSADCCYRQANAITTYSYSRTDLHRNSFLPRSICTWNDLNIPNIDTISLADFKKELI